MKKQKQKKISNWKKYRQFFSSVPEAEKTKEFSEYYKAFQKQSNIRFFLSTFIIIAIATTFATIFGVVLKKLTGSGHITFAVITLISYMMIIILGFWYYREDKKNKKLIHIDKTEQKEETEKKYDKY